MISKSSAIRTGLKEQKRREGQEKEETWKRVWYRSIVASDAKQADILEVIWLRLVALVPLVTIVCHLVPLCAIKCNMSWNGDWFWHVGVTSTVQRCRLWNDSYLLPSNNRMLFVSLRRDPHLEENKRNTWKKEKKLKVCQMLELAGTHKNMDWSIDWNSNWSMRRASLDTTATKSANFYYLFVFPVKCFLFWLKLHCHGLILAILLSSTFGRIFSGSFKMSQDDLTEMLFSDSSKCPCKAEKRPVIPITLGRIFFLSVELSTIFISANSAVKNSKRDKDDQKEDSAEEFTKEKIFYEEHIWRGNNVWKKLGLIKKCRFFFFRKMSLPSKRCRFLSEDVASYQKMLFRWIRDYLTLIHYHIKQMTRACSWQGGKDIIILASSYPPLISILSLPLDLLTFELFLSLKCFLRQRKKDRKTNKRTLQDKYCIGRRWELLGRARKKNKKETAEVNNGFFFFERLEVLHWSKRTIEEW